MSDLQTPSTPKRSISAATVELEKNLNDLQLEDIMRCTKLEPKSGSNTFNDVELEDLDEKISAKLNELKTRADFIKQEQDSNWILREEASEDQSGERRRWLVARNIENEVELSIDLGSLEVRSDQA